MGYLLSTHPNIELKLYNKPNYLKPWTLNGRMHDKYIIIDNKLLLLGGRNIGDKYFGPETFTGALSIDRDVLVLNAKYEDSSNTDSVLFKVKDYMKEVWNYTDYVKPAHFKQPKKIEDYTTYVKGLFADMIKFSKESDYATIDWMKVTIPTNKVTFISNDYHIFKKEPTVMYAITRALLWAHHDVFLQSPYIVLNKRLKEMIKNLADTVPNCTILTNSMASSPNLPAFSIYLLYRRWFLKQKLHVYEYQSKNGIHAKTYIADNKVSFVGSNNMDPRSFNIDTELMLAIDSEDFATELKKVVNAYLAQSLEVGHDGKYLPNKKVPEVPVPFLKRCLFRVASIFVWFFKYLI